ncbi:23S rRNA (guanosine(2251)-2'-O)-methyltransferase RlmB, partial [Methylophaga sp. 42_8_T64]
MPVSRVTELWLADERDDARIDAVINAAKKQNITVNKVEREKLDEMMPDARHQGGIARCKPLDNLNEADLFKLIDELDEPPFLLILDCVQDPHNLGACMRTAEAAGAH